MKRTEDKTQKESLSRAERKEYFQNEKNGNCIRNR